MSSTVAPRTAATHGGKRLTPILISAVLISAFLAAFGASLSFAPIAQASPQVIGSSSLNWGIKSSFRTYIANIALGSATASDGATKDTNSGTSPYTWTGAGGNYDSDTQIGHLDFAGKVVFSAPAHTIWNITISNPSIVFHGTSTGTIVADMSFATGGTQASPASSGSETDVDFGTFTVSAPTVNGSTSTFVEPAGVLTAEGSAGFGGFYAAGTPIDGFTATTTDAPPTSAVSITTASLPGALAGKSYKATLAASGGKKSYKWSVASGNLPGGLKLSSSGRFSGTATNAATTTFTLKVVDNTKPTANTATRQFSLAVAPVSVATSALPAGTVGKTYRAKLTATGGKPGLKWSIASGALPPGVKLTSGGSLNSKPTVAGTYTVTVKLTDNTKPTANTATKTFSIAVS